MRRIDFLQTSGMGIVSMMGLGWLISDNTAVVTKGAVTTKLTVPVIIEQDRLIHSHSHLNLVSNDINKSAVLAAAAGAIYKISNCVVHVDHPIYFIHRQKIEIVNTIFRPTECFRKIYLNSAVLSFGSKIDRTSLITNNVIWDTKLHDA